MPHYLLCCGLGQRPVLGLAVEDRLNVARHHALARVYHQPLLRGQFEHCIMPS